MKISQKLIAINGIPLLVFLVISCMFSRFWLTEKQNIARAENNHALFLAVSDLIHELWKERGLSLMAGTNDRSALYAQRKTVDAGLAAGSSALAHADREALNALNLGQAAEFLDAARRQADGSASAAEVFSLYRKLISELLEAEQAIANLESTRNYGAIATSLKIFFVLLGFALFAAAALVVVGVRSITRPIRQLVDYATQISSGALDAPSPKGLPHDLEALNIALRSVAAHLQGKLSAPPQEEAQQARLIAELEVVRRKLIFLETLIDELPSPVFAKTEDTRFFLLNKAYEKFFGIRREEYLGRTAMELGYLPPEERQKYQQEDLEVISSKTMVHYETVYTTNQGQRNSLYWSKGVTVPTSGEKGLVGTIVDISSQKRLEHELACKVQELEQAQHELRLLSRTDSLTGLANRRFFHERLLEGMAIGARHEVPLSLLMMDLDHFKMVNDRFGHAQGDAVLRQFAQILRDNCRNEDLPARSGGEEFMLLLPLTPKDKALTSAERIRRITCEQITLPDGSPMTVSLGVVEFRPGESPEHLLHRADEALYRAKKDGRNRVAAG